MICPRRIGSQAHIGIVETTQIIKTQFLRVGHLVKISKGRVAGE